MINKHKRWNGSIPFYVSRQLNEKDTADMENHIRECGRCRQRVAEWSLISEAVSQNGASVSAPEKGAENALCEIGRRQKRGIHPGGLILILRHQFPFVIREILPASLLIFGIGIILAALTAESTIIHVLAPFVSAAGLSAIFGPSRDEAGELIASTPTSPRLILLSRLFLVYGSNVVLLMVAAAVLSSIIQPAIPVRLFRHWLGPMTFLSASALLLSLRLKPPVVLGICFSAWTAYLMTGIYSQSDIPGLESGRFFYSLLDAYTAFWRNGHVLLLISIGLFFVTLWFAGFPFEQKRETS